MASQSPGEIFAAWNYRLILRISFALVLINSLIVIWSHRFFPSQDFPDWVYQGYLVSRLVLGHPLSGYRLLSYPVADSVLTPLLGLLDLAFAPEVSGKIVLSIEVLIFLAASRALLGALGISKRNPVLLVPLAYVFSSWLFLGNVAWLFGFAGYCWYCAYIIRRYQTPSTINAAAVLIASCALFLTHIAGWFAAGLFTCVMAAAIPLRVGLTRLLLPYVPSGTLAIWSFLGQLHSGGLAARAQWRFWSSHQLAGNLVDAVAVFIGFLPWADSGSTLMHGAAVVNLIATLIFVGLIPLGWMLWFRGERRHTPVLIAASVTAMAVVGAGAAYGIFSSPGGRLIFPAAWLAMRWIAPALEGRRTLIILTATLCTVLALQIVYVDVMVTKVAGALDASYATMRECKTRTEFCGIYQPLLRSSVPRRRRSGLALFLPTQMPIVRLPYYLYIERAAAAPINPVGILRREPNGDFNNVCGAGAIGPGF